MDDQARPLVRRSEWLLDPDISFLNHGSYGAVPRVVVEEQRRLQPLARDKGLELRVSIPNGDGMRLPNLRECLLQ
jgi:hypothetical protein